MAKVTRGWKTIKAFIEQTPRCIVIVGVGRGLECRTIKHCWPRARVIGVEPLRMHYKLLRRGRWQWKDRDLIHGALTQHGGDVTLFCNYEKDQRATLYPLSEPLRGELTETVPSMTLRDLKLACGFEAPTLLWMDAEGAELEILSCEGIRQALRTVHWLNIELSSMTPRPGACLGHEVMARCRELGYELAMQHTLSRDGRQTDGLFMHRKLWDKMTQQLLEDSVERKRWRFLNKNEQLVEDGGKPLPVPWLTNSDS